MLVYHSISCMKWTVITTCAGGGTMVAIVTAVLSRHKTEWATRLQPEVIIGACEEASDTSWRNRVLTPATIFQLFRLQFLDGNNASRHLPHRSGLRFSEAADGQARARLPPCLFDLLLEHFGSAVQP